MEDSDMRDSTISKSVVLIAILTILSSAVAGNAATKAIVSGDSNAGRAVMPNQATEDHSGDSETSNSPDGRSPAAGEGINWQVLSSGGTDGGSTSYNLSGTAGQTATGSGSSASYGLSHGFWQVFATSEVQCEPGDADYSGDVDIDDVVYEITYIFAGGPPPAPELCCGDADGSGDVDIDDVVYLITYIFAGGSPPVDAC
jgi:hypothetical protein